MKISRRKIEIMQARKNMPTKQLTELSGISRENFSATVRRGNCRPETAGKIARALGVDVTEIMEDEE